MQNKTRYWGYQFQQQLHTLLMHRSMNKDWCRKTIPEFLEMMDALKKSPFKALATLGRRLCLWRDEIARMWRFRKSNGITEGFHRKMKGFKEERMALETLKIIE